MRLVPIALTAAVLAALPACFSPVTPGGEGSADAGALPGRDAGGAVCAKDSDCPKPSSPDPVCKPLVAFCDRGQCASKVAARPWDQKPGACDFADQCACQGLPAPDCIGGWVCATGQCSWKCGQTGCETDLQCATGQVCVADCSGHKACTVGCRTASECQAGEICEIASPFCGDALGHCRPGPACTSDSQCPAGSVCDFADYGGAQRTCLAGCHQDGQCAAGEFCEITTCANCPNCPCYGRCDSKEGCQFDTQCPDGKVCGTEWMRCDLHCLEGCRDDGDCRIDQACAPPPPCAGCGCDHGTCYTKQQSCASDAECATGQVCAPADPTGCTGEKTCVGGCFDDGDCGAGQACLRSFCGACCPGTCERVSTGCKEDFECGPGEVCEGCGGTSPRSCMPGCRDGSGCKEGEICSQVFCGTCPCPAQCTPAPQACKNDYECGLGAVCEPGPGCVGSNQCVPGCHDSSQCPANATCLVLDDCFTCPCPGTCAVQACPMNEPACGSGLDCTWGSESCQGGCCGVCPMPAPPPCTSTQCTHPGGRDTNGCDSGPTCGACCKCPAGTPVCGENYGTYSSECEASCAGVLVLHDGACLPYEGLGCDWYGGSNGCAQGQYCRDPCPMCGSIQQLRCTQIGACARDWDCPGGLPSTSCPNGTPPTWTCANHKCLASCGAP